MKCQAAEIFIGERVLNAPGTAIATAMEGTRPLLVEIQALTSPTSDSATRAAPPMGSISTAYC
ncbi:MAG: hypothetical protein U0670_17460 [Anaerolineae bacterium]